MAAKSAFERWADTCLKATFKGEIRALDADSDIIALEKIEDESFDRLVGLRLPASLRRLGKKTYDEVHYFAVVINVEMVSKVDRTGGYDAEPKAPGGPRSGPAFAYSDRKKKL